MSDYTRLNPAQTSAQGTGTDRVRFFSYGKVCVLQVMSYATFTSGWQEITLPITIPAGLRPPTTMYGPLTFNNSPAGGGYVRVEQNGSCYMQGWNAPLNVANAGQVVWIAA